MCNFNQLDTQTKAYLHSFFKDAAQKVGGVNFLLNLHETLQATKPHPLSNAKCEIVAEHTTLRWDKIIFQDKITALEEFFKNIKEQKESSTNLLDTQNTKRKKRLINLIKTLSPVSFELKPKDPTQGSGFSFEVFEKIDFEDDYAKLSPVFVTLFFCSAEQTKKALKYDS